MATTLLAGIASCRASLIVIAVVAPTLLTSAPASGSERPNDPSIGGCYGGIRTLLADSNSTGEIAVAWEQTTTDHDGEHCDSMDTNVAFGSATSGFQDLGPVSAPGVLSFPSDISLDRAGALWITGIHDELLAHASAPASGRNTYGDGSAWMAFRPAGGSFQTPVNLGRSTSSATAALVAGNASGDTLLVWATRGGTSAAWGTATGQITQRSFFARGFQPQAVNVDEAGEGLIVGSYPSRRRGGTSGIALITSAGPGAFSDPRRIIGVRRKVIDHGSHRETRLRDPNPPVVGLGANNDLLIAWGTSWRRERAGLNLPPGVSAEGPSEFVYGQANGALDRPAVLPESFVGERLYHAVAAVDAEGRGIIINSGGEAYTEVTIDAEGHVTASMAIGKSLISIPELASNGNGQLIVTTDESEEGFYALTGSTLGINGDQALTLPSGVVQAVPTIDGEGAPTIIVKTQILDEQIELECLALAPAAEPVVIAKVSLSAE